MHYWVMVRDKDRGTRYQHEYLLDGLIGQHVIDAMTCEIADELGLCKICNSHGARCHVMVEIARHAYKKYCPVLWHDVFRPKTWIVKDLV